MARTLRLTPARRRTFVSTLFGLTALASVFTVSASNVLPCPVHPSRKRYADDESGTDGAVQPAARVVVERRPRRFIQETYPGAA
jgi:cytochrome c oxidase assembly factor 2